jgi:hypothetical protein
MFIWKSYAGWCPSTFKQTLDLFYVNKTELMHKTDTRVGLRSARFASRYREGKPYAPNPGTDFAPEHDDRLRLLTS